MTPRQATLKDVADLAGVSTAAASMALRGRGRISDDTRDRIRSAATELGYVGNAAARALRENAADAIAVVVPNTGQHVFGHVYFMKLLQGVNEAANGRDAVVIMSTNDEEENGVAAYERILRSRRADGAIIASAALDDPEVARMSDSGLPLVVVGEIDGLSNVSTIRTPDRRAAAALCRHLVDTHGRRRIAHIAGPVNHQTGRDRLAGYQDVLPDMPGSLTRAGDYSRESGAAGMRELLAAGEPFEAIFCANDEMAYGAMAVAEAAGMRLPDDLAVVGFDDFGLAEVTRPALTTIRVPARQVGRVAAERLFAAVQGAAAQDVVLDVELVVRQSCGCSSDLPAPTPLTANGE